MLYDFLVIRQLVPVNPTASVRGPKYVVKRGKTPVWSREDAKKLLESIPRDDLAGLRDRALISTMLFSFARISAVLSLKGEDRTNTGKTKEHGTDQGPVAKPGQIIPARDRLQELLSVLTAPDRGLAPFDHILWPTDRRRRVYRHQLPDNKKIIKRPDRGQLLFDGRLRAP